jgi:large subunit ribosomal protein L24
MNLNKYHIKKGDTVKILSGNSKGKQGKVLYVDLDKGRVTLEGLNLVKKTMRPTQEQPKGGIVDIAAPLNISNVILVCSRCNKSTRVTYKDVSGKKVRACKKCGEMIDKV